MKNKCKKILRSYDKKCNLLTLYLTKDEKILFQQAADIKKMSLSKYLNKSAYELLQELKIKHTLKQRSDAIKLVCVDKVFSNFLTQEEIKEIDSEVKNILFK